MAASDKHPKQRQAETLGLAALARRFNLGVLAPVIRSLAERNRFFEDAVFHKCDSWKVRTLRYETYLPPGQLRASGEGVHASASKQGQIEETTGRLAELSRPTLDDIMSTPDPKGVLAQEAGRIVRGMSQTMAGLTVYGSSLINPSAFTGIVPRYNSKGWKTNRSAGATSGARGSVIAAVWDVEEGLHYIYPDNKEMPLGIYQYVDGEGVMTDTGNGGEFMVHRTFFCIEWGLAVGRKDNVGRYGDIAIAGGTNGFDPDDMSELLDELWMPETAVCYAPQKILTQISKVARDRPNVELSFDEWAGHVVTSFQGRQFKRVDRMLTTESSMAA